jgi:hypothetical protein
VPNGDRVPHPGARPLVIRRIDPRSVAIVTAFIASVASLALWTATLMVWVIGSITGVVGGAEHFLHEIGFTGFHFMSEPIVGGMLILSAAGVFGVTAFATLMALAYNYSAETIAHLTIEVDDGDVPVTPSPPA